MCELGKGERGLALTSYLFVFFSLFNKQGNGADFITHQSLLQGRKCICVLGKGRSCLGETSLHLNSFFIFLLNKRSDTEAEECTNQSVLKGGRKVCVN